MGAPLFKTREWVAAPRNLSGAGIHDDETAKKLGFAGGFVPGVALYEHLAVEMLDQGLDWLHEGRATVQFRRPVYSGEDTRFAVNADDRSFLIRSMTDEAPRSIGKLDLEEDAPDVPKGTPIAIPANKVPLGDPAQIGLPLRLEKVLDTKDLDAAAALTGFDRHRQGADGKKLVPAGRFTNPVGLLHDYYDGPVTIHFTSRIWHHNPLFDGETLVTYGSITEFYERGGNQVVRFLVREETADGRPIATIDHASVYQLARASAK